MAAFRLWKSSSYLKISKNLISFSEQSSLIRCGIPLPPTANDYALLRRLGVRAVVDLRGRGEAAQYPSPFADDPAFAYYHIPLYEANPACAEDDLPLTALYREILTAFGDGFAAVLRLLPTLPQPFLFHCFCGKDRTGLLSALLLAAAGVDATDILADSRSPSPTLSPFLRGRSRPARR